MSPRIATAALLALALTARAEDEKPGLAVGAKAPAFTLKDQDGKERSLAQLLKKGKVALVFYRSADW
jgi:cytochrome oxidase Cu insertion factor (SCO1/SenC/PrrC family)